MSWTLLIAPLILSPQSATPGSFRLVESFPRETTLDAPDLPQTAAVWEEMIRASKSEIELAHFYAATAEENSLNGVIEALEEAADRGVQVRFLLSERFRTTYPEVPTRLDARNGIAVRYIDFGKVGGGVLHAKFMIVDGERLFLGSPNFDFRAMEHIQELGVDIRDAGLAVNLRTLFEMDWRSAGGGAFDPMTDGIHASSTGLLAFDDSQAGGLAPGTEVTLCGSPEKHLPPSIPWDLPLLVDLIDSAETSVRVQVLTYDATGSYDKGFFSELETALRSAAARDVRVQLLVADWCKREGVVDGLQSLAALDGIDVSFVVIPESSQGFVPFSRVAHAKLCVADEKAAWVGTSNWERSYFTTSRNVSVILKGEAVSQRLAAWFDTTWNSNYREPVVPGKTYVAPRRQ